MTAPPHRNGARLLVGRVLLVTFGLLLSGLCAASCSDVLGLNGRTSAAFELCDLIDRCFSDQLMPDCEQHVSGKLTATDADTRAGWLSAFGNKACLETCNNARLCLDAVPVCSANGGDCTSDEGCCGFSGNDAACNDDSCCTEDGRSCTADGECCAGICRDGLCGGQQCVEPGEPCEVHSQCCSGLCDPDMLCTEAPCLPAGSDCGEDYLCCSGDCKAGSCDGVPCTPLFSLCDEISNCCIGGDARCVFVPGLGGEVCIANCRPLTAGCGANEDCCSGSCVNNRCVAVNGCKPEDVVCTLGSECCSGFCYAIDEDVPELSCCAEVTECTHSVCEVVPGAPSGAHLPPLAPHCPCGEDGCANGGANGNDDCVAKICAIDPFCCCVEWDGICVGRVSDECGFPCPGAVQTQ